MSCLTAEQIEQLVSGNLSSRSHDLHLAHIEQCEPCARLWHECQANLQLVHEIDQYFPAEHEDHVRPLQTRDLLSESEGAAFTPLQGMAPSPLPAEGIPGYRIIREIHRGGQGVVFEAVQESTRRTVAVKVLLEGPFAGERSRWRFEREVRLIARLKHPNIVAIHDSGLAQGRYYFAMDYVRGQPLDTHARLAGLALRDIVRLFVTVCNAVAYAHQRGIIHRDLKPSNILVGEDGDPQVLDFGLAKITVDEAAESQRGLATAAGNILGTVRYMSPEQTRGDLDAIDTRSDVYSLGVILYELLIGSPPYETDGDLMNAFTNIREIDPPHPSKLRRDIPSDLDAIILKALRKEPERRYSSAEQFKDDLAAWLDGRPVSARSDSSFYVLRKLAAKHYFHTSVITALIASIIGFGAISMQALLRERRANQTLATVNAQFVAQAQDVGVAVQSALGAQHESALRWFLLEWQANRLETARQIQDMLDPASPEYAAMSFLLDESRSPQQLQAILPSNAAPLVLFVTGERHLKAGRLPQARAAFEQYVQRYRGSWLPLVESRLSRLGAKVSQTRPG